MMDHSEVVRREDGWYVEDFYDGVQAGPFETAGQANKWLAGRRLAFFGLLLALLVVAGGLVVPILLIVAPILLWIFA